jgi:hypothetical protein
LDLCRTFSKTAHTSIASNNHMIVYIIKMIEYLYKILYSCTVKHRMVFELQALQKQNAHGDELLSQNKLETEI